MNKSPESKSHADEYLELGNKLLATASNKFKESVFMNTFAKHIKIDYSQIDSALKITADYFNKSCALRAECIYLPSPKSSVDKKLKNYRFIATAEYLHS